MTSSGFGVATPWAGLVVAVGLLCGAATAAETQGADAALNAVARMNMQGAGRCSAVLIAPDRALTAAHCLRHPRSGRMLEPDRLHLLFGYHKGAFTEHRRVTDYRIAVGPAEPLAPAPGWGGADDVALLFLDQPAAVSPVSLAADVAGPAIATGYGAPAKEVRGVARGCRVSDPGWEGLIALDCPAKPGASGGAAIDAEGRLLGILIGRARVEGRAHAVAVPITGAAARGLLDAAAP